MTLEEAFKESDVHGAYRDCNGYRTLLRYIDDQSIYMIRTNRNKYNDGKDFTFPNLGAAFNHAWKNDYTDIKRYARDWKPIYTAYSEKGIARKKSQEEEERRKEEEREQLEFEGITPDIDEEFTFLDPEETGDLNIDRDIERGLDGRIDFNEDDPNVRSFLERV